MTTVFEMISSLGRPAVWGRHTKEVKTPYFVINGAGQDQFEADTTYYVTKDRYTVEYYFTKKDPEMEKQIEKLLLNNGFRYDKSEDLYLDDQKVFLIYYDI